MVTLGTVPEMNENISSDGSRLWISTNRTLCYYQLFLTATSPSGRGAGGGGLRGGGMRRGC